VVVDVDVDVEGREGKGREGKGWDLGKMEEKWNGMDE
jgi:hypothetical protein